MDRRYHRRQHAGQRPARHARPRLQARIMDFVPGKPFSTDNYLSLQQDNVSDRDDLARLGIDAGQHRIHCAGLPGGIAAAATPGRIAPQAKRLMPQVYLVGGAVRDELLGLAVRERDWVVTGATPASCWTRATGRWAHPFRYSCTRKPARSTPWRAPSARPAVVTMVSAWISIRMSPSNRTWSVAT